MFASGAGPRIYMMSGEDEVVAERAVEIQQSCKKSSILPPRVSFFKWDIYSIYAKRPSSVCMLHNIAHISCTDTDDDEDGLRWAKCALVWCHCEAARSKICPTSEHFTQYRELFNKTLEGSGYLHTVQGTVISVMCDGNVTEVNGYRKVKWSRGHFPKPAVVRRHWFVTVRCPPYGSVARCHPQCQASFSFHSHVKPFLFYLFLNFFADSRCPSSISSSLSFIVLLSGATSPPYL